MVYIVKNTYEKAGADVLLEYQLGPNEDLAAVFSDPRVLGIKWLRSEDRSYGQSYIFWESEESYNAWAEDNKELHDSGKAAIEEYMQAMNISFARYYPRYPGHEFLDPEDADSRITEANTITFEQIFE